MAAVRWDPRVGRGAVIAVPTVLSAALCLIGITSRSLGFDEGATIAIVSQHGSALGSAIARDGGNMSGYYLVLHVLVGWFGNGLWVLRLPSALLAVATVALVGVLGLQLFDRRVAFVAGLLAAVSVPLVYWAQTARGYAPMVAFVCAAFVAFVELARADDFAVSPVRRRLAWAGYVVAMVLAAYCSFVAVLVVPVQLLAIAGRPRAARRLVAALLALAVGCVPLVILAVRRGSGQLFWVPKPSHKVDSQVLQSLFSTGLQPSFHHRFTTTVGWIVVGLALLVLAGATARARRWSWPLGLTLTWIALPVALTFVYSLVSQPLFEARNLLTCLPAVALALAVGICDPRLPRGVAVAAFVIVLGLRAVPLAASYGVSPEPWHQATAAVLHRSLPGDCVVFYPEDGRNAFQYYVGPAGGAAARRAPRSVLPAVAWGTLTPYVERYASLSPAQLTAATAGCRRLWFVSSHEGQTDGSARSLANRVLYHRFDSELERAFGPGPIEQYGYASAVHVQLLSGRGRRRPGVGG
jgi:mannosyltransferase